MKICRDKTISEENDLICQYLEELDPESGLIYQSMYTTI